MNKAATGRGYLRRRGLGRVLAVLMLALPLTAVAQTTPDAPARQVDQSGALLPRVAQTDTTAPATGASPAAVSGGAAPHSSSSRPHVLNYDEWGKLADQAETAILNPQSSVAALEHLRAMLADWREALYGAENDNAARIATVRTQVAALGPLPADGQVEAPEIAKRRSALSDQLVQLQAPALEADEAYQRAIGLIGEIDRVLHERQAAELLKLWPMPVNPANWPDAFAALSLTGQSIYNETRLRWHAEDARKQFADKLPVVLSLAVLALGILWRGRKFIDRLIYRLQNRSTARGRQILAFLASLGQVVVPVLGLELFARALLLTGMLGVISTVIVKALPELGLVFFAAIWLGGRVFPVGQHADAAMAMTREERAEGRFLSGMLGFLLLLDGLRQVAMDRQNMPESAASVLSFPLILLTGLFLFRTGQLLYRHARADPVTDEARNFATRVVAMLGRGAMALGAIGPLLAGLGYVTAAGELVYSSTLTLALVGLLSVLERLVSSVYALVTRRAENAADTALLPVLMTFAMTLSAIPVLALIWGARSSDLGDLWTGFRNGITLGDTRISPEAFVLFLVVFAAGYGATRLMKEVLRVSILPRTRLDHGGQTAVLSGVGYIGIFLAAIVGIKAAGIDLSGFAMIASALSLGIGFGMQTIVSNFVSGVILLIERPISEGDWIEVGPVQGIVQTISVRSTRIQTFDRSDVIVPNSDLITGRVTNWTRFNMSGRLIVPVGVAFGSDSRNVEKVLQQIAEAQPLALLNPPPVVVFTGFGADSMNFEIRVILRDVNYSMVVRSEINHQIVERFTEAGIVIPFAQREVTLRVVEPLSHLPGQALEPAADLAPEAGKKAAATRRTVSRTHGLSPLPDDAMSRDLYDVPDAEDDEK